MKKQMIEVEVPDGMEIDTTTSHFVDETIYMIRLQKIKPRMIVLEETDDVLGKNQSGYVMHDGKNIKWIEEGWRIAKGHKIWREVKETNSEPKLSLNVDEVNNIGTHDKALARKLYTFIKENS